MRSINFSQKAFKDFYLWSLKDKKTLEKISELILECCRTPFTGKGKPEPLKNQFKGMWSRRINSEDRLVYSVTDEEIFIVSCEGHYT